MDPSPIKAHKGISLVARHCSEGEEGMEFSIVIGEAEITQNGHLIKLEASSKGR